MAKHLKFEDYTATYEDQDGDEHEHTVRAAVVTDELVFVQGTDAQGNPVRVRREVMTPTGARQVQQGDVFVETDRPGVYDHLTAEAWASTGYSDNSEDASEETPEETSEETPEQPATTTRRGRKIQDENS